VRSRSSIPRGVLLAVAAVAGIAAVQFAPAGTSIRTIDITLTEGTSMAAAVSPDRRWIAFDLAGALWVMPFRGGEATRITPPLLEARQPTWSPDSDSIAFQAYDDSGAWHIYAIRRDGGEPRAVTSGEFDDREPAWSHDGSRIAFSSDRSAGTTTIWAVSVDGGPPRQLSRRDASMPAWAPDDRTLAVVSADRIRSDGTAVREAERRPGLWSIGDGDRPLVSDRNGPLPIAAAWSRSGALAFVAADGSVVAGGFSARDDDVFPFRPTWISDLEIVYTANGHIVRRSPVATSVIPFTARVSLQRASYTIAHRELEPTGAQPVKGIVAPAVSPDGRAIAFVALGDVWMLPKGGRPARLTNDEAVELDPAWSPDGSQIAYASDSGGHMDLWIQNVATGARSQVTRSRAAVSNPAWSPDGSHIAYLADRQSVVAVQVRRGDGLGGTYTGNGQELGRPTWSPDSRSVAFGSLFPYSDRYREGLNGLLIHSFEFSSTDPVLLRPAHSAGNRQSGGPVWSRDGAQMAFVSEGQLWNVAVDDRGAPTSAPYVVADDQPEFPSWEADSRHLVYLTPAGFRRVLSDGSAPETIPANMQWTPDLPPPRLVIHAGRLFDGVFEGLRGESDIVVERGIIREVSGHRDDLHTGVVIAAPDETVMPGLVESHAHLDPDYGVNFGRAWLAYGVTSVRIPAINAYAGLELREAIENGRRPGPRVFLAGDPFDGTRVFYPGGVSITSDAQLDRELDRAQALGMDFFKTYVRLPDRFQMRVVERAHAAGTPVTSHELFPAVAFGVDGVEHLRGTSRRGYSPKASSANRAYQDVVETIARSGMTLTPTIGIQGAFVARTTGDRSLLFDPRLGLFPSAVVARLTDLATAPPDRALDGRIRGYEETIKAISGAGGRIIAGTDAPIDPYGLGLHVEIESYVHAGLTPFQALQTATINAAQALGLQDRLGTIEPGRLADFAFITGDPLTDIRATRSVTRVMKGGRIYRVADLIRR
jgi:Tol biopolymer transport system component/imidazolonepropionase-like amidohydrolase